MRGSQMQVLVTESSYVKFRMKNMGNGYRKRKLLVLRQPKPPEHFSNF